MTENEDKAIENSSNVVNTQNSDVVQNTNQSDNNRNTTNWFSIIKTLVFRMIVFYFITSFFRKSVNKVEPNAPTSMHIYKNAYLQNELIDIFLYLSESPHTVNFEKPLFLLKKIKFASYENGDDDYGTYTKQHRYFLTKKTQNNGTLYLHSFLSPHNEALSSNKTALVVNQLTKFKKVVYPNTFNLLNESKTPKKEDEIKSHIHNNVTVNLLSDFTPWQKQSVPAPLSNYLKFDDENKVFMPVMYLNDYWNLNEDYQIINDTLEYIDFTITFYPISLFRWQLYTAQNVKNNWVYKLIGEDQFGQSDNENDAFKKMILETNIYLLIMTMIISLVHSIFEFFAFKNDIQFWKSRKSLEGLSVRSVIFNVFQSIVIALYVFDNDTNFVIKVSVFVGLLIELWKITKVVNIKVIYIFDGKLPFLQFSGKSTYIQSATQKYDKIAFKYLAWLFFPLFVGYSIYSLLYENHKGWYSWGLGTTYGFLLMFGFIMMFPQLFINYNLKSVAHLPWRMLTYKALNTFIDDIFAFAIKMPTLYRIGCFRDDIVFFIYLYQKWVYKVDPKRVNEFGTSQEMIDNEQDGSLIKKNE